MELERILELSGIQIDPERFPMPDGPDRPASEYNGEVTQRIGPLEWDGVNEEPIYVPVTAALLRGWAEEHGCDLDTVRVVLRVGNCDLRQEIEGKRR